MTIMSVKQEESYILNKGSLTKCTVLRKFCECVHVIGQI